MIAKHQLFATKLKEHGFSLTKTRRLIFDILGSGKPFTMRSLVAACSSIDRASVYRTVAALEKAGIIHRVYTGWKYQIELSDAFHAHHHHATCQRCGRSLALHEDSELEMLLKRIAASKRFMMTNHTLEIHGICEECHICDRTNIA